MYIPEELIPGIDKLSGPLLINRNADGIFKAGRVLRGNEFVTNMPTLIESLRLVGLYIVDSEGNRL
ncbi:hypothetical protein BG55_11480 [Erwinia mallotivora]|uniref:Uncharacterized protein n=1 Tax=Erwinia mallotivora TaxID=69222 RepID=A0A014N7H7_9GAMM|nr:hypothetical protein BG55_11480 [Erwinia mallotivora]